MITLRNETKNYDIKKIIFELSKIISKIGDSHTQIQFRSHLTPLPFKIDWFDDGFLISEIDANNLQHLGKKLTSVNGTPIMDVVDGFRSIISYENESNFKNQVVEFMTYIEFCDELEFNESTSKLALELEDGFAQ